MFVEELEQHQIDKLKELVFWNNEKTKGADFGTLSTLERQEIDYALFESDIPNKTIFKLFRDIYFNKNFCGVAL